MNPADELIVENFRRARDPKSFEALVKRYQSQLYNVAYRMVLNREDAEDMVQETFVRLYTGFEQLHRKSSFHAWVLSIIHNLCRDLLRAKQRRLPLNLMALDLYARNRAPCEHAVVEASGYPGDPSRHLDVIEQATAIESSLHRLSADQRAVVVLHHVENLSYQQIADITGANLGTVRSRLHYGRLKLRMMLEPYFAGQQLKAAHAQPTVRLSPVTMHTESLAVHGQSTAEAAVMHGQLHTQPATIEVGR